MALPGRWAIASVSQFSECLDGQRVPVKKERRARSEGKYPYYGANGRVDWVDDFIFDDELVLVTEDETFYGREKPIAYRVSGKCWVNNHAHVLRPETRTAADYLCYALMHYNVLPWLTGTTGRAKLTQAALNSLPLAVPPLIEQEEIVRRVRILFSAADQIEEKVRAAEAQVGNLTKTLLARAFRGELVIEDAEPERLPAPADVEIGSRSCSRALFPRAGKRGKTAAVSPRSALSKRREA
jgi:type I restriction enzyme S subunit